MNSRPRNSYILAGVGITSVLLLANKSNREKLQSITTKIKDYMPFNKKKNEVMEKAGHPMPQDTEDNKMVSEGALYSVNYFNEKEQQ
ncbi:hypothetical protein ACUXCC_003069 [Cytobacillus horneckiae]|uniref:hypothetical protein n=1 Tax=Cytobacillus horneckiae TaxID=549687 RepID=UPI001561B5CB|nr:hypothetical protein [Cytobacillus horneckiae]MBN6888151.1 hypothetical protein [Cytobacillus horneckiae]MCM3177005.1 hypothetical protein [Cytobacillus horneckiae]NRG48181.1 hypothetical protein [Bacillus sp. CRN 9]